MNLIEEAENLNTSPERLSVLATDENCNVRWWVAWNPNTPAKTLEQLSYDKKIGVCCAVARNLNTPVKLLELLAFLYHEISNPNTPHYVKKYLERQKYLERLNA
jgi:hypothetical protein